MLPDGVTKEREFNRFCEGSDGVYTTHPARFHFML